MRSKKGLPSFPSATGVPFKRLVSARTFVNIGAPRLSSNVVPGEIATIDKMLPEGGLVLLGRNPGLFLEIAGHLGGRDRR